MPHSALAPIEPSRQYSHRLRKAMSVSTLGLVDFRSEKERTARYTRHTRNAVRAQSKMQAELARQEAAAAYRQAAVAQQQMNLAAAQLAVTQDPPMVRPQAVPPGWYHNPAGDPAVSGGTGAPGPSTTSPHRCRRRRNSAFGSAPAICPRLRLRAARPRIRASAADAGSAMVTANILMLLPRPA